jgi:hypothetical protein
VTLDWDKHPHMITLVLVFAIISWYTCDIGIQFTTLPVDMRYLFKRLWQNEEYPEENDKAVYLATIF